VALANAGAAVAVLARSADQVEENAATIRAAGGRALAFAVDVTEPGAIAAAVRETGERLGPVDLLVSCAGSFGAYGPIWEVDPDLWWRDVEVNLRGPFHCARAVVPGMIARHRGRIVIVSSVAAFMPYAGLSGYAASKAGAIKLAESLAAEVKEHGLSVFAIQPGMMQTAMVTSLQDWARRLVEGPPPEPGCEAARRSAQRVLTLAEQGRLYGPEGAVALVLALASGRADALSGRFISDTDDVEQMILDAERIQRDDLYTMRLRK
jgi:NAD(P)-dependent dehydrogenase (short-subunit alcohol dehydrogenase family)